MSDKEPPPPKLKDVEPGSDADETPPVESDDIATRIEGAPDDAAAAMPHGRKPGPPSSPVQVRDAGEDAQTKTPENWDDVDEAIDESFPASDAGAKY